MHSTSNVASRGRNGPDVLGKCSKGYERVTLRRFHTTSVAKAVSISLHILSVCYKAYVSNRVMRMRNIVIYGLSDFTIFFRIISQKTRFSEKVAEHKVRVLIFSTTL